MTTHVGRVLERVSRHDAVVGVVVGGGRGKGVFTDQSDWDVYLVVRDGEDPGSLRSTLARDGPADRVELCGVFTVEQFEAHAAIGGAEEWNRYNFAHLVPELDRTPGRVLQHLCDAKEWLPEHVAAQRAPVALDAFLNAYYRALKNERDGYEIAAALDAAEAVTGLLNFVFTVERRVRPYNKFLAWELARHPLARAWWPGPDAPSLLLHVLRRGTPAHLAPIFRTLERQVRALGLGQVVDDWGTEAVSALRGGVARG